jgi:uncharacterized delta-60 repeat protein
VVGGVLMGAYSKSSGLWSQFTPWAKLSNAWARVKEAYVKDSGEWKQWWLDGGVNDRTFAEVDVYSGFIGQFGSGNVYSLAERYDGKILAGGSFGAFNGKEYDEFALINENLTSEESFRNSVTFQFTNSVVYSVKFLSDNKIALGGFFTYLNNDAFNRIALLNSDGTSNTIFLSNIGSGFNGECYAVDVQSDNKILAVGSFSSFNGSTVNRIVRLNSDGTMDTSFTTNTGTGLNNIGRSIAVQSDGKIIVGGFFTTFNGTAVNRIARLNSDGTLDTSFISNIGTGANSGVLSIAFQSDGKILLGGSFTTLNGSTVNRIVRLNSDGTMDTSFTTNTGTAFNSTVNCIAVQSDGKIIVGGLFTTFNETTVNRIVRLNSDGTRDTDFSTNLQNGFNSDVNSIIINSDGKIFIAGAFAYVNGKIANCIIKLNSNGTKDNETLTSSGFDSTPWCIKLDSDDKILVGGDFTTFNETPLNYLCRLNAKGTVDQDFTDSIGTGFNSGVEQIDVQNDGKIIAIGYFSEFNGTTVNTVARINTNGTLDTAFATNIGSGHNDYVNTVTIQPDGKILIGGYFTTFNGATVNYIVRLNSDGTRDTVFTTNLGTGFNDEVNAIELQSDGKIIVAGWFTTLNGSTVNRIVRLNSDGTRDTSFTTNVGAGADSGILSAAIQSDDKIVIGGQFSAFNGTSSPRLIRLNSNGTIDNSFSVSTIATSGDYVYDIKIQSDEKIVAVGRFGRYGSNGVISEADNIIVLNSDGTIDQNFSNNAGKGFLTLGSIDSVRMVELQANKKIVVSGRFRGFNNVNRTGLAQIGGE